MLKRILLAVGILTLGFILVVGIVNYELGVISNKVSSLADVISALSRGAEDSSDHTASMMVSVSEACMTSDDQKREELKAVAKTAGEELKKDIEGLLKPKFRDLHRLTLKIPGEAKEGEAAVEQTVTVETLLRSMEAAASKLGDLAVTTVSLAQKLVETKRELLSAQEELSRVYRNSSSLATLDAKGFNTVTRSVLMLMYSRSLGDTNTGRAKFEEGIKALRKANPTPEQESQIHELQVSFEKTNRLSTESLSSSDDYKVFTKSANAAIDQANALTDFTADLYNREKSSLKSIVQKIEKLSLTISVATIVLGVLISVMMAKRMIAPLKLATDLVTRVSQNDLTSHVAVTTTDEAGQIGSALNLMVDNLRNNVRALHADSLSLSASSTELSKISHQVTSNAEQTRSQTELVTNAAKQVSGDISSVSAAVEEMNASMAEIMRTASEATRVSNRAAETARGTNATVEKLGESSSKISDVVKVISGIAAQTNLLALNATIEAARAGEAGRGFAVVAQEVKNLAQQTSQATGEIAERISAIQADADSAVSAIVEIAQIISKIDEFQTVIAGAVQEQGAAVTEISRSLSTASVASQEITANIENVAEVARDTTAGASEAASTAESLSRVAAGLRKVVEQFTLPAESR